MLQICTGKSIISVFQIFVCVQKQLSQELFVGPFNLSAESMQIFPLFPFPQVQSVLQWQNIVHQTVEPMSSNSTWALNLEELHWERWRNCHTLIFCQWSCAEGMRSRKFCPSPLLWAALYHPQQLLIVCMGPATPGGGREDCTCVGGWDLTRKKICYPLNNRSLASTHWILRLNTITVFSILDFLFKIIVNFLNESILV